MRSKFFICFILGFSLSMVFWWFRDKTILGGGESGIFFYNIKRYFDISNYSWANPALGNSAGTTVAGKPTYWFLAKIESLGVPPYVIQASFFWFLLVVAGVSVFLLIKEFFPEIEDRFAFLGTAFYWFNPISLVNVWNRFLYNYMVFWAYLPFALLLFIKGVKNKDFKFAILTSLSSVVFSFALTSVPFNLILWFLFFYTTLFYLITKNSLGFLLKYFSLTLISFILFNFWWISQVFSFTTFTAGKTAVQDFFSEEGNLATLTSLSKSLGKFIDIIRYYHGTFFSQPAISWAKVYDLPLISVFGFFFVFLVLWVILKFKKRLEVLFLGILFLISLFLVKGNNPPLGEIFEFFFTKFTILQVFRNPFEKFGFLLAFSATPLFALGVSEFSKIIKKEKLRRFFVGFTFFYCLVFLGFPFWTGLVFTRQDPITKKLETYEVKVPDYYKKVNEWFKSQGDNFRFVSLPIGGEGMTYTWEKPYSGVELSSTLFETPNISFNTTIPFYNSIVSQLSQYQLSEKIFDFFPFLNVDCLLIRSDINYQERKTANPQSIREKSREWKEKGLIDKVFQEGELSVYKVNNSYFWPKIYTTRKIFITDSDNFPNIVKFSADFPKGKLVILNSNYFEKLRSFKNPILIGEPVFLGEVNKSETDFRNFSDEDILARLFYARHLPTSPIFPLIRFKENLEISQKIGEAKYFYEINLLGKRAVEVYKSYKEGDSVAVAKAEANYNRFLTKIRYDTLRLQKLKKFPKNDRIREILYLQKELLERINSSVRDDLSFFLKEIGFESRYDLPLDKYLLYKINIPTQALYELVEKDGALGKIYIDGKLFQETPRGFSPGEHELVIEDDIGREVGIFQEENFNIDNHHLPSWTFDLPNEPTTFKIKLNLRFLEGEEFEIIAFQDIETQDFPLFKKSISKPRKYHDWLTFEFGLNKTLPGAKNLTLKFRPPKIVKCQETILLRKCFEKEEKLKVEIKNFSLIKVRNPLFIFFSPAENFGKALNTEVSFEKINPTFYKVFLKKEVSKPEFLVFSELFSNNWQAVYGNGEEIPQEKHFLVNGYANGWILERSGEYEIDLRYEPQEMLVLGEKISMTTITLGIIFLGISSFKKRIYEN